MDNNIVLTPDGLKNLENELDNLKSAKRKEIAEKIKNAMSFGDLSENSEYDEAKNEQAMVEARIAEIEELLKNAEVLDEKEISKDKVSIGSKVKVKNLKSGTEMEYQIFGSPEEIDPINGKISFKSPLGEALMGNKVGATVSSKAPAGEMKFKILKISK